MQPLAAATARPLLPHETRAIAPVGVGQPRMPAVTAAVPRPLLPHEIRAQGRSGGTGLQPAVSGPPAPGRPLLPHEQRAIAGATVGQPAIAPLGTATTRPLLPHERRASGQVQPQMRVGVGFRHGSVVQRMDAEDPDDPDFIRLGREEIPSVAYLFAAQNSVRLGHFKQSEVGSPKVNDLAATHIGPDAGYRHFIEKHATRAFWAGQSESFDVLDKLVEHAKGRNEEMRLPVPFRLMPNAKRKSKNNIDSNQAIDRSNAEIDAAYGDLSMSDSWEGLTDAAQRLHNAISFSPGNLPDYGPHTTVNVPVSDRIHPNFDDASGRLTPKSRETLGFDFESAVAVSAGGNNVLGRRGFKPIKDLHADDLALIKGIGVSTTGLRTPDLPEAYGLD
jgi:hypothetical protein